ncbi:hypothetical protein SeGA_4466 [Salmonella enterica subsp. enterica serovar Gaminara str. A4-567]|nr:hypothetical protein SeGA_4466 [Salmonella enterica subsp. enterica serovar Gaminara str. A4-567]
MTKKAAVAGCRLTARKKAAVAALRPAKNNAFAVFFRS